MKKSIIASLFLFSGIACGDQLQYIPTPFSAILMSRDGHVFVGAITNGMLRSVDLNNPVQINISLPEGSIFTPTGISGDGNVIVGYYFVSSSGYRSWRWTPLGGIKILIPTGPYLDSQAMAVSDDGKTIVGMNSAHPQSAYIWKKETLAQPLPGNAYVPFAVSENGDAVVGQTLNNLPFYWTKNNGIKILGSLNNLNPFGWATVLSANGLIISGVDFSISYNRPVCWINEIIIPLNATSDPNLAYVPVGISYDGSIIVGNNFRYTENSGIQNLSDMMICHGLPMLNSPIVSISGDGLKILTENKLIVFPSCPADLNNDGVVDDTDFSIFVIAYDNFIDATGDLNYDCYTDDKDFSIFVVAYDQLICE